mmetsp:Transcript_15818/g.37542  ORF Transcript_15818/g.37542 Transcript_15818/m.37542 type:complete len:378 (-) Transcript_15818:328-1461(-)
MLARPAVDHAREEHTRRAGALQLRRAEFGQVAQLGEAKGAEQLGLVELRARGGGELEDAPLQHVGGGGQQLPVAHHTPVERGARAAERAIVRERVGERERGGEEEGAQLRLVEAALARRVQPQQRAQLEQHGRGEQLLVQPCHVRRRRELPRVEVERRHVARRGAHTREHERVAADEVGRGRVAEEGGVVRAAVGRGQHGQHVAGEVEGQQQRREPVHRHVAHGRVVRTEQDVPLEQAGQPHAHQRVGLPAQRAQQRQQRQARVQPVGEEAIAVRRERLKRAHHPPQLVLQLGACGEQSAVLPVLVGQLLQEEQAHAVERLPRGEQHAHGRPRARARLRVGEGRRQASRVVDATVGPLAGEGVQVRAEPAVRSVGQR